MKFDEMLEHSLMNKEVFFVYSKNTKSVTKIGLKSKGITVYNIEVFDSKEAAETLIENITLRDFLDLEVRSASLWDYIKDYYGGSDDDEGVKDDRSQY